MQNQGRSPMTRDMRAHLPARIDQLSHQPIDAGVGSPETGLPPVRDDEEARGCQSGYPRGVGEGDPRRLGDSCSTRIGSQAWNRGSRAVLDCGDKLHSLGFRYAKIGQRGVVPCTECGEQHSAEDGDAERRPYLPRCALDARALAAAVQWYVRQHNANQLRSREADTQGAP
jgi:hypothetical protein